MGRKTPFIIVALVMAMSGWTAFAEDKSTDTDASTAEVESGHTTDNVEKETNKVQDDSDEIIFAEVLANMNLDLEKSKACLSSTTFSGEYKEYPSEDFVKLIEGAVDLDTSFQVFLAIMESSTRDVQCFPRNCPWSHEEIDWDDDDDRLAYARWMANASAEDVKACLSSTVITPLATQTHAENWLAAAE